MVANELPQKTYVTLLHDGTLHFQSLLPELADQLILKQSHIDVDVVIQKLFQEVSENNFFEPLDPQVTQINLLSPRERNL